jgi:hypothetical protein
MMIVMTNAQVMEKSGMSAALLTVKKSITLSATPMTPITNAFRIPCLTLRFAKSRAMMKVNTATIMYAIGDIERPNFWKNIPKSPEKNAVEISM